MIGIGKTFGIRHIALGLHGIGMLVAMLVIASSYFFYSALGRERTKVQIQKVEAEELLRSKEKVLDQHSQEKQRVASLEATLVQLRQAFPAHPDETGLLANLSQMAEQTDIEIHNFRAGSIRTVPTHKVLEVSFRADGSYAGLCEFLSKLHDLPRRVHISQLNIVAPMSEGQVYTIDVELRLAFALVPAGTPTGASL